MKWKKDSCSQPRVLEIKAVVVVVVVVVGLFEDSFTYKKDSMPFHLVALYIVKR